MRLLGAWLVSSALDKARGAGYALGAGHVKARRPSLGHPALSLVRDVLSYARLGCRCDDLSLIRHARRRVEQGANQWDLKPWPIAGMFDFCLESRIVMTQLDIDLVSDVVCPWCAIGLARLRLALDQLDDIEIRLAWHPFLLNPDIGADGRDMVEHLTAKYGKTPTEIHESQQQIIAVAKDLGLDFDSAAERRSWNTFDTHRVLHYAREAGQEQAFNEKLFAAYFGAAANPTDPTLLGDIGVDLGLDRDRIAAILASDEYAEAVQAEIEHYRQLGVSAVPSFIVDNRYLISGAQPPDALADGLRRIAEEKSTSVVS